MRVVLYTTADDCPLCTNGWIVVEAVCGRRGLAFETVEVESDPALRRRLRDRVPVLEIDGREAAFGRLDARTVDDALSRGMVPGDA
jgi:glutaredoxin